MLDDAALKIERIDNLHQYIAKMKSTFSQMIDLRKEHMQRYSNVHHVELPAFPNDDVKKGKKKTKRRRGGWS